MKEGITNFAYLMDLLEVKASALCAATGADKTLVSRWRTGKRKLMPGNHWAGDVAAYFVRVDGERKHPVLADVLAAYYPGEQPVTPAQTETLLVHWLTSAGQREAEYQKRRDGLFGVLMEKMEQLSAPPLLPEPHPAPPLPPLENTVVWGVKGVQGSTIQCIELLLEQPQPQEILYVCPEGLDMYTRDEKFGPLLMDKLMEMFAAGHKLHVVLRTDYRMTDVSAFSGRWLVAHLLGYIQSYYFDDFHASYRDKMLAVAGDRMALQVTDGRHSGKEGIYTAIYFDKPSVEKIAGECKGFRKRSRQRFHYRLFEQPDGFLRDARPLPDRAHYQFARLPHFCMEGAERTQEDFTLSDSEIKQVRQDFGPLLCMPEDFETDTTVRHIFCGEAIEDALLKSRHGNPELSAMLGRRVLIATPLLVKRLARLKQLLETKKNYEVCFLPEEIFQKLTMQIACWGDVAAIGWIPGGKSTACKDYTNSNALTGFCESVWSQVPGPMKNRRTSLRKVNTWLKMAEKYGYDVR